ncbi:MAG: M48 family metallopeptidase [Deltaproteobacteria bacterium]|nr:M48 family metallopeptidase [Deltaproteobacteria bacterium]
MWTLNRFDEREEVDLGIRQADLLIASAEQLGHTIDPDDEYTRAVRRIAGAIFEVPENRARMPPFPWEVHVIGSEGANAWCFPGGQLLVLTGLMRSGFVQDEDEAAAIVGHEIAHAAARHGTEKETLARIRAALGPLARFFGPRLVELLEPEDAGSMADALSKSAGQHDQAQELEADLIGLELMARAGYDPAAAPRIWARLRAEPAADTHPPNAVRMRELLRHVPTARWLATHRTRRVPDRVAGWRWKLAEATFPVVKSRMESRGVLPEGTRLATAYVRRSELLKIEVSRTETSAQGRAVRIRLVSSAGLSDDRLPVSGVLLVESKSSGRVVHAERLWQLEPIEPEMSRTIHLPRIDDSSRLVVRAIVGALWFEEEYPGAADGPSR